MDRSQETFTLTRRPRVQWLVLVSAMTLSALLFATTANASPIEIRFDGGWGVADSMSFSAGGVSVTATANGGDRDVSQNAEGLGVYGGGWDSSDIDGLGPDDFIDLVFSEQIQLLSIDFEQVDSSDESALIVDGGQIAFGYIDEALGLAGAAANCSVAGDSDECVVSLDLSGMTIVGNSLRFGDALDGTGFSLDTNDDFRVEAIRIRRLTESPVPEPTAALLFAVGLAVAGRGARKR